MHTHNREIEKSSGQAAQFIFEKYENIIVDRSSAQPRVNLSLLCSNSFLRVRTREKGRRAIWIKIALWFMKNAWNHLQTIFFELIMYENSVGRLWFSFTKTYNIWNFLCKKSHIEPQDPHLQLLEMQDPQPCLEIFIPAIPLNCFHWPLCFSELYITSFMGSNPDISQECKMGDISKGVANTL